MFLKIFYILNLNFNSRYIKLKFKIIFNLLISYFCFCKYYENLLYNLYHNLKRKYKDLGIIVYYN